MSVQHDLFGPPVPPPAARGRDRGAAPWTSLDILITLFLVLIIAGVTLTTAAVIIRLAGVPADAADRDPVGTPILLLAQVVLDTLAVGAAAWMSLGKYHLSIAAWRLRPRRPFAVSRCAGVL